MRTPVDYTRQALHELLTATEQLAACLQQGVERPWKAPTLTIERRNQLDHEARAERLERDDIAPGESPAPLDLDVLDRMSEILDATELIAGQACTLLGLPKPPPAMSALTDPRPHLRLVDGLLAQLGLQYPSNLRDLEQRLLDLVHAAQDTLGLTTDGQLLKAICPWCGGRTEQAPTGGQHTLRVRNVPQIDGAVVTCEGGQCEPSDADCGTWVRGRPAWLQPEWDWLADRIDRHAAAS